MKSLTALCALALLLVLPALGQAREASYEDRALAESIMRDHLNFYQRLEALGGDAAEHHVRRFWFDHWSLAEMVREELDVVRDRAKDRKAKKALDAVFGRDAHDVFEEATKALRGLKTHHQPEFVERMGQEILLGKRLLSQFDASAEKDDRVVGQPGFEARVVTREELETVAGLLEKHRYLFEKLSLVGSSYEVVEGAGGAEDPWILRAELDRLRTSLREELDRDETEDMVKNVLGPRAYERLRRSTQDLNPKGRAEEEEIRQGLDLIDQLVRLCPSEGTSPRVAEVEDDAEVEPGFAGLSSW